MGVASLTSNNRNIPFIGKRNNWLGYLVVLDEVDQWNGNGKGWEQGSLEHGKEICSSSSPTRCSKPNRRTKTRKRRKEKAAKTRVSYRVSDDSVSRGGVCARVPE